MTIANNARITVVATSNPKRKGSASASRFRLYAKAGTVAQYVAAVTEAGYPERVALADLDWDRKRDFIKVGAAKSAGKRPATA